MIYELSFQHKEDINSLQKYFTIFFIIWHI